MTGSEKNKMYHLGNNVFKIEDYPNLIEFEKSGEEITAIKMYRSEDEKEERKWRIPIETLKTLKVKLIHALSNSDFKVAKQNYLAIKKTETDYDFTLSLQDIGVTFYNRGNIEKAISILEFNLEENPKSTNAIWVLAEVNERVGNTKEALKYYQLLLPNLKGEQQKEIKAKIKSLN